MTTFDQLLDSKVSSDDIQTIANIMPVWEKLRTPLGFDRAKEKAIRRTNSDYEEQKQDLLESWKEMCGNAATYRAFIEAAEKAGNKLLADRVKEMLRSRVTGS